jgi:DNA-binding NarL/FixJ family response regulator
MPSRKPRIRVLVVDGHRAFAEALGIALGLERGFEVEVAATPQEAIEVADGDSPDVVLLDLDLRGAGGVATARRLKEAAPHAQVVAISARDEDVLRARAVAAGVVGFLSKTSSVPEIAAAVRRAHAGEPLMELDEVNRLVRLLRRRRHQESTERQRVGRLTPRQTEILQMMADGIPAPEIAARLNMSPGTLRTHVQNIMTRLGTHRRVEAVSLAIRQGRVRPGVPPGDSGADEP